MTKSKHIKLIIDEPRFKKLKFIINLLENSADHKNKSLKDKANLAETSSRTYMRIKQSATYADYKKLREQAHPKPTPTPVPEILLKTFPPVTDVMNLPISATHIEHLMNALNQTTESLNENNKLLEELTTVLGMKKRWFS